MQNLDEKKAVMTEIIDFNDLGFSDWENFTDDIDIASLEHSLQITESNIEAFNDKIINCLSDGEYYSQKIGDIDLDSLTCGKVETLYDQSFEAQLHHSIPSLDSNTLPLNPSNLSIGGKSPSVVFLEREPTIKTAYNLPKKMDSYVSNTATRNIFLPYEKSLTSNVEKSFSSPDNLRPECTIKDQRLIVQEYPNRKDKNTFFQKNYDSRIQNEEDQKYTGILPHVSRLEVFDIQESSVTTSGTEMIVSSKVITSNQKNLSSEENTYCENITPFKENFDSQRMIFLSEENFDSQKMIISSQGSSDGQRMVISSQETSDSQIMITSSQESCGSEKMIISSQEFSDSQKMITSSQEFSDSLKMITSSQDISDSQKMIISSQDSLDDQRMIILSQESFGSQKIFSSQSFDSKNLLISNQVPEDQKVIPTSPETSVRQKMFNTRPGSFLKVPKKINLKIESKNYQSVTSRLSLKEKKLHKFLDFKRLSGVMTTQYNGKKVSPPASIGKKNGKESKIIHLREVKFRKIEIDTNKQKKLSIRDADSPNLKKSITCNRNTCLRSHKSSIK